MKSVNYLVRGRKSYEMEFGQVKIEITLAPAFVEAATRRQGRGGVKGLFLP